jgi:transposase-like protein
MPASKPSYPEEFKREVLAYQASTGSGMKETAFHFGISTGSLHRIARAGANPTATRES